MTLHANGGLYHRAVLHARQDTPSDTVVKTRATPRLPSTRSVSSSTGDRTTSSLKSTTRDTPRRSTSSTSVVARPTSTPKGDVNTPPANKGIKSTPSPIPSAASASPTAAAATIPTRKGSIAGGIIGTLAAIAAIIFIAVFIVKRTRKRRDRLSDARYFNKNKLERPGMVQGIAAGPGVCTPNGSMHEKDSRSPSIISNNEKALPPSPYPSDALPPRNIPASSYGNDNPFSPDPSSGFPSTSSEGHQDLGAPPMPGINGPASYSPYMATFSKSTRLTPPGSPFTGGYAVQNPFATPRSTDTHPSSPGYPSWTHIPMGSHMPLLPGGAFGADSYRDSGYSAAYSEVHVEQAYKVQVGVSRPKYEDLTRDDRRSPPPPFTPFDPAATVNTADVAYTAPAPVARENSPPAIKPLPRPPSSHTVYSPEEAYGGV